MADNVRVALLIGDEPEQVFQVAEDCARAVAESLKAASYSPAPFPKWVHPEGKDSVVVHSAEEEAVVLATTPVEEIAQ